MSVTLASSASPKKQTQDSRPLKSKPSSGVTTSQSFGQQSSHVGFAGSHLSVSIVGRGAGDGAGVGLGVGWGGSVVVLGAGVAALGAGVGSRDGAGVGGSSAPAYLTSAKYVRARTPGVGGPPETPSVRGAAAQVGSRGTATVAVRSLPRSGAVNATRSSPSRHVASTAFQASSAQGSQASASDGAAHQSPPPSAQAARSSAPGGSTRAAPSDAQSAPGATHAATTPPKRPTRIASSSAVGWTAKLMPPGTAGSSQTGGSTYSTVATRASPVSATMSVALPSWFLKDWLASPAVSQASVQWPAPSVAACQSGAAGASGLSTAP